MHLQSHYPQDGVAWGWRDLITWQNCRSLSWVNLKVQQNTAPLPIVGAGCKLLLDFQIHCDFLLLEQSIIPAPSWTFTRKEGCVLEKRQKTKIPTTHSNLSVNPIYSYLKRNPVNDLSTFESKLHSKTLMIMSGMRMSLLFPQSVTGCHSFWCGQHLVLYWSSVAHTVSGSGSPAEKHAGSSFFQSWLL